MHRIAPLLVALVACGPSSGSLPVDLGGPDHSKYYFDLSSPTPNVDLGPRDLAGEEHPDLVARDLRAAAPDDLASKNGDLRATAPADLSVTGPSDLAAAPDLASPCGAPCDSPPASYCQGLVQHAFNTPGSCVQGACDYPDSASSCLYGCLDGNCTAQLSYLGDSAAFVTNGRQLNLFNDTIPVGSTVSVITQTYPRGSVQGIHAVYTLSTDTSFQNATDLALAFDKIVGNNDQWYTVLPAQTAGTTIVWYLYADGWDATRLYDSGAGANFRYTSQ